MKSRKPLLYTITIIPLAVMLLLFWKTPNNSRVISKKRFTDETEKVVDLHSVSEKEIIENKLSLSQKKGTKSQPAPAKINKEYRASESMGIIGAFGKKKTDNPKDNFFQITLPQKPLPRDRVYLVYELNGVLSGYGISKSVNDEPSHGGYLTVLHKGWTLQRETINPVQLQQGVNRILFTLPSGATYGYAVRNVKIEIERGGMEDTRKFIADAITCGNKTYLSGIVPQDVTRVTADGRDVLLHNGVFEGILPSQAQIILTAHRENGADFVQTLSSVFVSEKVNFERTIDKHIASASKKLVKGKAAELGLQGSKLRVDTSNLLHTQTVSITALRDVDVPALDYAMTNVTAQNEGYRFLPHGTHFAEKGAKISLAYDRTRIPSGYTEDDIHTYYFDNETKHWVALERDSVDRVNSLIVSNTTHFTDMINGVIQAPESPETEGFAPTMMNDIKAADPTARLNVIVPPSANQRGSADLDYSFEMPPARNGMAPSLGIRYSSEGGSGWLGEGWNLSIPSITVDTRWGVPRYNTTKETETYSMSGSMLSTTAPDGTMSVAHRGEKIGRKADRQFYTRQAGDFSRIIRKGDNPANYTWEVTDKQGTKYTYGGNGGILKGTITDIAGQTREVITEWKLSRVKETHGDWVEYSYAPADEPVRGGLTAKALYLTQARAGNSGKQAHTVVTFESNSQKELKTNNARYGFLTSSNKLLDKLSVAYRGKTLRSYTFTYTKGAFFKEILEEIKQLDNNGTEFAHQKFDYYDDVKSTEGYVPFKTETEKWNTEQDNLSAEFINPVANMGLENFSDKASAMGGSKTTSRSTSLYTGVGAINGDLLTKSGTIGGSFAYSRSKTNGISTLVDINGDGLPDKVFRSGNNLYFRPQILNSETEKVTYGDAMRIQGINRFSEITGSATSGGIQGAIGWGFLTAMFGKDFERSKTETKTYFSDVNGDGLVDIVSNGKVYFNKIITDAQGNAVPSFTLQSSETPSPIMAGGTISSADMEPTPEEQEEAVKYSPMQDVVRVWEAPLSGKISIVGTVQLQLPTGDYDQAEYAKADGVRVAIQKGGSELWKKQISKGDGTKYHTNISSLFVTKGQRIYFRVQSGKERLSNGAFDKVQWSPIVVYLIEEGDTTPEGYMSNIYRATEGNVLSQTSSIRLPEGVAVRLSGEFVKPQTSDSITVRVFSSNDALDSEGNANPNYREQLIYIKKFAPQETHSGTLSAALANTSGDLNFRFEVYANTNVAWEKISWKPLLTYTKTDGKVFTLQGSATYSIFAEQVTKGRPYTVTKAGKHSVKLKITDSSPSRVSFPKKITVSVKSINKLLTKKTFNVTNRQLPPNVSVEFNAKSTEKVWIEIFTPFFQFGHNISKLKAIVTSLSTNTSTIVPVNVFTVRNDSEWGAMYRGWGQFAYNTAEGRYALPIDESSLELPQGQEDIPEPLTMAFVPLSIDAQAGNRWIGAHEQIHIENQMMQPSRMGDADVVLTNPLGNIDGAVTAQGDCLQGTSAFGITLVSKSTSSANLYDAAGVTRTEAKGKNRVMSNFQDMNGDRYPDIITTNEIQFTNTQGGFDGEVLQGVGSNRGESKSTTWSYGGNPVHAAQITATKLQGAGKANQDKTSSDNAKNGASSLSVSLGKPVNEDWAIESIQDVNGDGLPDKILEDKRVMLNLGYAFSQPINWGLEKIQEGKSTSYTGGLGVSFGASSVSAGFGLVTTVSNEHYNLSDVNSDGLPDKVWQEGDNVMVALNKGNEFDAPIIWKGGAMLSRSASSSESANTAFTINIPIWIAGIKIAINPSAAVSQSMNRSTYALRDVDGDGYLDIVTSDKDSEMHVTRSAIGRTNMLKSVTNSLGGRFEVDYKRSVPTYDNPGSKWVMAQVTVDDGIRDDGPVMKTRFEYADGRRDRHEREFLGFGKVIAKSIDTENSDAVYRKSIQEYDVRNYYTQGRLVKSRVEDAAGNAFAEIINQYDTYKLRASADNYTFTKDDNICSDRGSAFVPLRYTANKQYEGGTQGMTTSEAWNEYYLDGYFGELKSYKYSDKGNLGANGSGAFDYQTLVTYAYNRAKHILGFPTQVTVSGGGQTYRRVTATYDINHPDHITKITQDLGGQSAVTDFTYDRYGNIIKKTLPANSKGQRMWYEYRYEPVMNMYVERISDAFGYRSEVENFDYRYGVGLRHRDLNNFYSETEIDNMGRIVNVTGPNELAGGKPYTLAFEYHSKAIYADNGITAPAYAVTKHYDVQHPTDPLETVTFVDGFGRAVQVKKDGVVTTAQKGSAPSDQTMMIVSGRAKFDAFGRVKEAFYPVTEALGSKTTFNKAFDKVQPTRTAYDVLDRALSVTLPDKSVTQTAYTLNTSENALVTTVTDALGNQQASHANGSGKTVKTEQFGAPAGVITTRFEYDGIQRLVKVTDTEGNETLSTYDMGDRRKEVNHPASGITKFTYDALGNVLTKQTANLNQTGKQITYEYDYFRLTAVNYPDHPENNVKYYYGGVNASHNRKGRLMLREDGTGAEEYFYGKMGEVTKVRRTLIVPNQAIATYVTQWKYDSHNRLLEMTYPDEEKITYSYNLGGLLEHVRGYKSYGYDYVNKLGYDKFEQRAYLKYCNGAETFYTYDPARRRLSNLAVYSGKTNRRAIMDNAYTYDAVSNVLSVANNAPLPTNGAGGNMQHTYTYDNLYRLATAAGTYTGAEQKTAGYNLAMSYDNMHRITAKKQHITQKGVQFDGTLNAGYDLTYAYAKDAGKKFQLANVQDLNYRTEETPDKKTENNHAYSYDKNGNLVYVNTAQTKLDGTNEPKVNERKLKWDEENRLLAVDDNGFVSNYWYDAAGERTVKTSGDGEAIYVNSLFSGGTTQTKKFTLYVSPYLVASQGGKYTKHIYIGSQRIVSKLGDLQSYGADPRRIPYAGSESDNISVDYKGKYAQQQQSIKHNYASFDVSYNGKDNNDYVNGSGFCCTDQDKTRSLAPGQNDNPELYQFYYHPDHLGSSSFITNLDGDVMQHIEYVPFGEVFIEERNNVWNTPYLFNAKELDEETGLYYYGARYYDPRISLWLSVDPLADVTLQPYSAFNNNPIFYIDPDGRMAVPPSTHLDDEGNVVAVFDDGDNGVYQHGKNADGGSVTEYQLSKRAEKYGTSSNGTKIGETEHWDEFISPEDGSVMTNYQVQVGKSFDPIISEMNAKSKDMNLIEIAQASKSGKLFDIKTDYKNVGGLLNGKYATSRSAGNFLAGYNAEGGTILGAGISFTTFQKLAGALHIENSDNKQLSKGQMLDIVTLGTYISSDISKFKAPTWGEVNYQYRMSKAGWQFGANQKK